MGPNATLSPDPHLAVRIQLERTSWAGETPIGIDPLLADSIRINTQA